MEYIAPLEELIEQFHRLPGVGRKTAVRLAFGILELNSGESERFADNIAQAKNRIKKCKVCFNISDGDLCPVCLDAERDRQTLCVVEDVRAVMSFEKVKDYNGVYHVLEGTISPVKGTGPDRLHVKELIERIKTDSIKEVILATNPTPDGETTSLYLAKILKPLGVKISRLAYGLPAGVDLEYTDEITLHRAIEGRHEMQ